MKLSKYLNISRIEFIATYHCTGRCIHCSVGDKLGKSIDGHSHVDGQKAAEAIKWLAEHYAIGSVMTFGGEPLLYPDDVCAIHRAATDSGIPKRQIITNGYFTNDRARMTEVARNLAYSGLNEALISVDAFHQQRIPVGAVLDFARTVRDAGISARISPAWLVNRAHQNPYNARTEELIAGFDFPVGSGNDIFMAGNAIENLADYYPAPCLNVADRCGSMPYTDPLTGISSISITPNGDVEACSFVIGNIYREHISDIAARYDPFADETMRAVMEGVPAMLKLAENRGIKVDISGCYSICGLCRMLNRK